jgi:hypothetical protein
MPPNFVLAQVPKAGSSSLMKIHGISLLVRPKQNIPE